jgi:hypothetical protein
METNPTGVYAEALGLCWRDLDDALRRLHGIDPVAAAGIFRIQHGNLLTRLIAWSARLPSTSDGAKLQLTIVPDGNCQKWRRDFAGRLLLSTQWKYADAIVAERVGIIEVHLHLEVVDGALHHRAVSARLRLGRMR